MSLRDYQDRCVESIFIEWDNGNRSTVAVMPTGSGKTVMFAEVIRRMRPQRSLVIAHREELIWQARDRIKDYCGLDCEIEMGELSASETLFEKAPVVIATVQTLISGNEKWRRMQRFNPQGFGLVVVDEAHHCTADSYRAVLEHFYQNERLKVLGVTATPDRADEEALGKVFDSVAFDYEILDAIREGWLVDVRQMFVPVEGLDFSHIRTTAGDLNGGDLAAVMEAERTIQGVVHPTLEMVFKLTEHTLDFIPVDQWSERLALIPNKHRAIVFTASVKQAETLCNIFNRAVPGLAAWVCGNTPKDQRREILGKFASGDISIVCNCNVLTEGFDDAGVELIVMARPTKSRSLYAQMCGRATRPIAGLVDPIALAADRLEAIRQSKKPSCTIMDFVGNSGRHKLISAADILGGNVSDEAIELAVRKAKAGGEAKSVVEELDEAEEEVRKQIIETRRLEEARKARLVARVKYQTRAVNPFEVFELQPHRERGWDSGKVLSEGHRGLLMRQGIDPDSMSYSEARRVIVELFRRWNSKLATFKQLAILKRLGYPTSPKLTMSGATQMISGIKASGWKRYTPPS